MNWTDPAQDDRGIPAANTTDDPTPDELIAKCSSRQRFWARMQVKLQEWLRSHPDAEEA